MTTHAPLTGSALEHVWETKEPSMNMSLETLPQGVTLVRLAGRLDLVVASKVKQSLTIAAHAGQHRLVIDLGEVSFMDSSGLGTLIGGLKAARLAGGDLRIARPREQARGIFRLTSLDRVLTLYPTIEEACAWE
ncbi:MAG TPA: STAS domain-containing protein [Roseiflexaceae bacterium]|nr:STAS domain-containing protein [Roseiflexaceae bacterium]